MGLKNEMGICEMLEEIENKSIGRCLVRYMRDMKVVEVCSNEFFVRTKKRAALLVSKGMTGKHIGIIGQNSCDWLESLCAVFYAGAVAVLIDSALSSEMVAQLVDRVEIDGILYDESLAAKVESACLRPEVLKIVMSDSEDNVEHVTLTIRRKPEELACIFFTSGTTANSKAVMMSSRALAASVGNQLDGWRYRALLAVLPFHHLAGFATVLNALYLGSEVCLAGDIKYFYRYLEAMKPDYVSVVPSMFQVLARRLKNGGDNGKLLGWDLHYVNCGGATFHPELLQIFLERNISVFQGYGASEAGGIGFLCKVDPAKPETIGKPPEELKVKIVDDELLLKSESVMMGYYRDEVATKEVLVEGWYKTGDLCYCDEEGYIYLTGRKKNLIILSNGENVSPEEIEMNLYDCKEISEVVVGERQNYIEAVIFPEFPVQSDEATKEVIMERIRGAIEEYNQRSPFYKQIRRVLFRNCPFEKTAGGKIIRQGIIGGDIS